MLRPGQAVALCALALLAIGVVMVNSAGMTADPAHQITIASILTSRASLYFVLAVIAMAVCSYVPVRLLADRLVPPWPGTTAEAGPGVTPSSLWPLWVGALSLAAVLGLVYVPGLSREVNGSSRWIEVAIPGLGGLSIQPSELVKWGVVALCAWYGASRGPRIGRFWTGLVPVLGAAGGLAGLVVLEDLGTGVLIGAAAGVVLLAAGARFWHMALLTPLGMAALVAAVATSEYRIKRLTAFLDPYADPRGTGFHMIQSMVAIANGNGVGRGLGHGLQKFGYLWGDETDFVFSVICEELGIAGAALVVFLFIGLLWSGYAIIRGERQPLLKLAGVGVLATIGIQAVINIGVVTGLGPTKGIALPMVSAGGTGWILTAASLGLLIAVDRYRADSLPSGRTEPGLQAGATPLPAVETSPPSVGVL